MCAKDARMAEWLGSHWADDWVAHWGHLTAVVRAVRRAGCLVEKSASWWVGSWAALRDVQME